MSVDVIANFLTIIRNGVAASKPFVIAPYSKMCADIAQILKQEGFIKDAAVLDEGVTSKKLKISLSYVGGEAVIHEITRASTPGGRYYTGVKSIEPVIGGLGISILTTNRGVVSNKQAEKLGVGGEVICTVW